MKRSFIVILLTQLCFFSYGSSLEKDNITINCKPTTHGTKFEYLDTSVLGHATISNNGTVPCIIDASHIFKNKLRDEAQVKSTIEHELRKKHRTKYLAYSCGTAFAGIATIFLFFKCDMYYELYRLVYGIDDLYDPLRLSVMVPPITLSLLSLYLAKKHHVKSKHNTFPYLDYIILCPGTPIVVLPGTSIEKIFALENPHEELAINSEAVQTKKNIWENMTSFFSKK